MTKIELDDLLKSVLPTNTHEGSVDPTFKTPYIAYWETEWEFQLASTEVFNDVVTYQISFFSDRPRHPKLLELLTKLREQDIFPSVRHEFVDDLKVHHSAFTLDVMENILG